MIRVNAHQLVTLSCDARAFTLGTPAVIGRLRHMGAIMSAARDHGLGDDYEWPRPPEGGWTAEDLDRLPDLPPHTELIDGSLVFVSPQTNFHSRTVRLLDHALLAQVPDDLDVIREMTIKLNKRKPARARRPGVPRKRRYRPSSDLVPAGGCRHRHRGRLRGLPRTGTAR